MKVASSKEREGLELVNAQGFVGSSHHSPRSRSLPRGDWVRDWSKGFLLFCCTDQRVGQHCACAEKLFGAARKCVESDQDTVPSRTDEQERRNDEGQRWENNHTNFTVQFPFNVRGCEPGRQKWHGSTSHHNNYTRATDQRFAKRYCFGNCTFYKACPLPQIAAFYFSYHTLCRLVVFSPFPHFSGQKRANNLRFKLKQVDRVSGKLEYLLFVLGLKTSLMQKHVNAAVSCASVPKKEEETKIDFSVTTLEGNPLHVMPIEEQCEVWGVCFNH